MAFTFHGVHPATARLPPGWEERSVAVASADTHGNTGWCLEPHDLAASKLIVPRVKDLEYVAVMARHRLTRPDELQSRVALMDLTAAGARSWTDDSHIVQVRWSSA